jgi:hypothetical protein
MCLNLEPYDVERLEQLCHFTSRSKLVITWFTLHSPFLKHYHSITHPPYHSFPQEVPMLHLEYCKSKENSKEFVWQIIMIDGEWCSERG